MGNIQAYGPSIPRRGIILGRDNAGCCQTSPREPIPPAKSERVLGEPRVAGGGPDGRGILAELSPPQPSFLVIGTIWVSPSRALWVTGAGWVQSWASVSTGVAHSCHSSISPRVDYCLLSLGPRQVTSLPASVCPSME